MVVYCSILILMDLFLEQERPSVEEGEIRKHLNNLDIYKSVGPDWMQP